MQSSRSGSFEWDVGDIVPIEEYETALAKQRASVAWIVQKAHKNKVPAEIQEPYYKDYEGQEHLKPSIVHRLSNADLYCSALANIYTDPNYHQLSHWNIIQALARKGVYVAEPTDVSLTETVLIQTTPIKMSAHLAVIEAMMALYIREVVVAERVAQSIRKVSGSVGSDGQRTPQDQDDAIVLWVDAVTQALQHRIRQQLQGKQKAELPVFPKIQDLSDLSDGIGLAALIAFYCPQDMSWGDIAVADPPSMADSLYNIGLVIKFCTESLPYNPCLLTKEDIVYMHSSVKQNILAFVSELFFLLELEPVSCVTLGSKKSTKYIQLSQPGMRPAGLPSVTTSVRRSHSMTLNDITGGDRLQVEHRSETAPSSHNSDYGGRDSSMSDGQDADFMVQKAKGFTTLSDMMRTHSPRPSHHDITPDFYNQRGSQDFGRSASREALNYDRDDDIGQGRLSRQNSFYGSNQSINDVPAAGIPSRQAPKSRGRSRSRTNSISVEESQLTIENFGGSQDNLNYLARNTDKEHFSHSGKRESLRDREGSLSRDVSRDRRSSSQNRDRSMDRRLSRRGSMDELDNRIISDHLELEILEREKREIEMMKAEQKLEEQRAMERERAKGIQREIERRESLRASQEVLNKDRRKSRNDHLDTSSESDQSYENDKVLGKATSFAELSKLKENLPGGINIIYMQNEEGKVPQLKDKRGSEKRTTFAALPNQTTWKQQSVQSQSDDNATGGDDDPSFEPQVMPSDLHNVRLKLEEKRRRIEADKRKMEMAMSKQRQKLGKEAFMQAVVKGDLGTEVTQRWLDGDQKEGLRTPDMENMDYDDCNRSINQMADSLTELQTDINRMSQQQNQIQALMHNGNQQQQPPTMHNQFYLHDQQQGSPARRMWNQGQTGDGYQSMSPATRRQQWGPARPMIPQNEYMMGGQQPPGYYPYQHQLPPINHQMGGPHPPPNQYNQGGFMLHNQPQSLPANQFYHNGQPPPGYPGYPGHPQLSQAPYQTQFAGQQGQMYDNVQQHRQPQSHVPLTSQPSLPPSSAPQPTSTPFRLHEASSPSSNPPKHVHAPVSAPPKDLMEPQNVCFIDDSEGRRGSDGRRVSQESIDSRGRKESKVQEPPVDSTKRMSISSGSRTYRISNESGSPTRPQIGTKTFRVPTKRGTVFHDDSNLPEPSPPVRSPSPVYQPYDNNEVEGVIVEPLVEEKADKGFYISLGDDAAPKRPKPPLRSKRMSQRKISAPSTPAVTPSGEDLPPIPDRSNPRLSTDSTGSPFGSLKLRRDSETPKKNISLSALGQSTISSTQSPSPRSYSSPLSPLFKKALSPTTSYPSHTSHSPFTSDTGITPSSSVSSVPSSRSPFWVKNNFENEKRHSASDVFSPRESFSSKRDMFNNVKNSHYDDSDDSSDVTLGDNNIIVNNKMKRESSAGMEILIGEDAQKHNSSLSEMEKKKEKLMMMSMRRKQQQEEQRRKKEMEVEQKRESEKIMEEEKLRKKEEERQRRELILEKHKIKKAIEEAEKEGRYYSPPAWYVNSLEQASPAQKGGSVRMRARGAAKPRPKTMHFGSEEQLSAANDSRKGSSQNLASDVRGVRKSSGRWGSSQSLSRATGSRGSTGSLTSAPSPRTLERGHTGRRPTSVMGSASVSTPRDRNKSRQSEHDSLLYHASEDSGLGRATPPRRAPSPGMSGLRHPSSPCGPGSLPPGLVTRRRTGVFDDNASDISYTSSNMDYAGPRLFKQPTSKSNRSILLNAVEYCVFPGAVNQQHKNRVLEEIHTSEARHFLILFRDSGCQYRALYSYNPESEEVWKLYGTGPKQVNEKMFDKFFKYNSGGKCFSQIHTKHLTVTIDAFTIHNSLWQGKKVNLPSKRDMKLVI